MRALSLAALLAAPLAAQPTAADSALVERVVAASNLDLAVATFESMETAMASSFAEVDNPAMAAAAQDFAEAFTAIDVGVLADSVRSALYADLRPDLLREALDYLEGPVVDEILAASPMDPANLDLAAIQELMAIAEDPGDRPLADSALTARFTVAMLAATQPAEVTDLTQRLMTEAVSDALPPPVRERLGPAFVDQMIGAFSMAETMETMRPMMARLSRVTLAEVSREALEASVAFYESEAGTYVTRQSALGSARATVPVLAAAMGDLFRVMFGQMAEALGSAPEAVDAAEVMPEIVGGMAALSAAVVYPDGARRDGVEGQVIVQFVVDERGRVSDPVAIRTPDDRLSQAAIDAVLAQRFTPGIQDGQPVKIRFAVPITFRLEDPEVIDASTEVYETVEEPPVLIGGLYGLQARVEYPEEARRANIEGQVVVQFIVDEQGRVTEAEAIRSPHFWLSDAAVDAVERSWFEPGRHEGQPVKVMFAVPVTFRLR